ncbi:Major_facilitator superfamily protein [Hexamita inflata]|uniref:Major facilitator superfamily protein n=2 Tax=Hexamita inflata TaxID=28002 RepID=A0AA86NHB7_9EUKA|nr:Major facilitator superfamily protein [Hexamita inflata]
MSHQNENLEWKKNLKFILVTIPMFMGYATCFNLQRYMKETLMVEPGLFSTAYGFLYMGNLLFRFFHNYFWIFTKPFWRIIISYASMCCAEICMIIVQIVKWDPKKNNSWLAFITFAFAGVGIGTFESNVLSVMSIVSPGARYFSVIGIPVGVNIITIFSFLIIGAFEGVATPGHVCAFIFGVVIVMMIVATIILFVYVPHGKFISKNDYKEINEDGTTSYKQDDDQTTSIHYLPNAFKNYKKWLPQVLPNALSMCANMFTVSQFAPGIVLYTINSSRFVKFLGMTMKADYYRCIFGVLTFLGDFCSRLIFEKVKFIFPPMFLMANLIGVLMVISGIPEVMIIGNFMIMFSNGIIYVQTSKWIKEVTKGTDYNLSSYSFWLFVGDLGSVVASFTQQSLVQGICVDMRGKMQGRWDPCPYYDKI